MKGLTIEQKRKICADAPEGASVVILSGRTLRIVAYSLDDHPIDEYVGSLYIANIDGLQKEIDEHDKMLAIVEVVNDFRADVFAWTMSKIYDAEVCAKGEFNQCVKEMTGCKAVHAEWLAEVNAKRDFAESVKSEWQNGDECVMDDENYYFIGNIIFNDDFDCALESFNGCLRYAKSADISKPESAEQKASAEREEMAKALYELQEKVFNWPVAQWGVLAVEAKEGYRKMVDAGVTIK
jgi:hypothetical protein